MDAFEDRLDQLRERRSIAAFAKDCGIQETTMRLYFNGSIPGLDKAQLIAEACGVTLEWLATGKGAKYKKELKKTTEGLPIRIFDVAISAGDGCFVENESQKFNLTVSAEMAEMFGLSKMCVGAFIRGDSMFPKLKDGDIVIMDTGINTLEDDGIYVFSYDNHCYIKQLQKIGHQIKVKSLNSDYESWKITDADTLNIIGKLKVIINRS